MEPLGKSEVCCAGICPQEKSQSLRLSFDRLVIYESYGALNNLQAVVS